MNRFARSPFRLLPALLAGGLLALGCAQQDTTAERTATPEPAAEEQPANTRAKQRLAAAAIEAKSGSGLTGAAHFSAVGSDVHLHLRVETAPPGTHAVHLHEVGDCSAADGTSAGGHWNPTAENHGRWETAPFHRGDIGNLEVGEDGVGEMTLATGLWTIGGADTSNVIGRAVVVHAGADDFTSQPTGNAGGRIGCGVIHAAPM